MGKGKFGGSKGVTGQTSGTENSAAGVYGQAAGKSGAARMGQQNVLEAHVFPLFIAFA